MNSRPRVTSLEFGSLLSYTPRGASPKIRQAKQVMLAIKADDFVGQPPIPMSRWLVEAVKQEMSKLPFAHFFSPNAVLVPVPSSSLMQPGTLWVPARMARSLVAAGIGSRVLPCLTRVKPLRKAAMSDASSRPVPSEQYETMGVQGTVQSTPKEIVLVDDIVTRGATFLGAANRLAEAFPYAEMRSFAAMRTISDPNDFESYYKPEMGWIKYREETGDTLRRP